MTWFREKFNIKKNYNLKKINFDFNLEKIFKIAIFFLPSAPLISGILIFISGISSTFKRKGSYFSDKWNIPFFILGLLMIISTIFSNNQIINYLNEIYNFSPNGLTNPSNFLIKSNWLNLFNWIPYFWFFWVLQYFSFRPEQRKSISLIVISGSVPVFLTGIMQYFFNFNGPFIFLNGLITWYSKPITDFNGLSGLFSNANYTGTWLNIIWPFSIAFLLEKKDKLYSNLVAVIFLLLTLFTTIFTLSRNAWLGLILGLIIMFGPKILKWLIPLITFIISPIILSTSIIKNQFLINFTRKIVPKFFWEYKFNNIGLENIENFGRLEIWKFAIEYIQKSPFWGWGSSTFPLLFEINKGLYKGHTHNLFLELSFSYGVLSTLLFSFIISRIIWMAYKKNIYENNNLEPYDQAWKASFIIVLFSQMFDLQYFDFRVGIMFWFLLSGLRNLIK